jgi:hemerythrin-like metal-binding protein
LISWTPQLSVGIDSIDSQHKRLIDLINELHAAMMSGKGADVLSKTLDGLASYTATHFSYEENLMRQTGFSGFTAHCAEHAKLIDSVRKLQQERRSGKTAISLDVMKFLRQWLRDHIAGMDRAYTQHLVAAGVK